MKSPLHNLQGLSDLFVLLRVQVEVKAVPVSQKKSMQPENVKKLQRLPGSSSPSSSGPDLTFGGLPMPKLEATYEPMIVKEARYIAITMMKVSIVLTVSHSLVYN